MKPEIQALAEAHRCREELESRAHSLGQQLESAATYRRGLMMQVGELMRDVDRLRKAHPDNAPEVDRLAYLTTLSKPTLYKQAREYVESTTDPQAMSLAELARLHAGYGYGGHEHIDQEFWDRQPALGTWRRAIDALNDAAVADKPFDPWEVEPLDQPAAPGVDILERRYREMVDALAEESR